MSRSMGFNILGASRRKSVCLAGSTSSASNGRLRLLGTVELWGEDKSTISRFLPENFPVAMPMGLTRKTSKGGSLKGPIMKPDLTSFSMSSFTTAGSAWAD